MKKKIALLLAIVLVFTAAMTGCGKKKPFKDDNPDQEYQIKWFAPGTKSQEHDMVFEEISKYTKEKINATVTQTLLPSSEYAESIQRLIFAGEPIDAMFASSFPKLASDGIYLRLNELIDEYGQDMKATLPDYVWKAVSVEGTIYAFPPMKDYAYQPVLTYMDGLVEKYNMDFSNVKTIADLEPMLQTIKDNEPGIYPIGITGKGDGLTVFLPIEKVRNCNIAGFQTSNYDKVVNIYETQEFKDYFDLMRRWNQKGFFRSDAAAPASVDLAKAHKMFLGTTEKIPYFQEQKNAIEDEGWKSIFDGRLSQPIINTRAVSQSCVAISADSENPVRTMKFFNMMYTDAKLMNMIVHGIEGTHYTVVDEKHVQYPNGIVDANKNNYFGNAAYQGNRFLLHLKKGDPDDLWDKYIAFNNEAYISPTFGFNFDSANVMNELTAINNVHQEFIPSLMVGAVDPAVKLPEALEKFRKAGSEKVIAEIQSQYDAWKANN
ncbi:MAG: ABC transporter substrate-binding protein [Clostridia bacterium]|nr:ABC transporter substrate-binding protein [Clostridia bacterium]